MGGARAREGQEQQNALGVAECSDAHSAHAAAASHAVGNAMEPTVADAHDETSPNKLAVELTCRKRARKNSDHMRRANSQTLKWTLVARQQYMTAQDRYERGEGGGVT